VPLIDSLIAAVLKSNGDGLVMHVGERPYVLTPSGPANVSDRPMGVEAMNNVLADLLSVEDGLTLREMGAVEKDLPVASAPGETFRLIAAKGGDDIWIEFRRQRPAAGRSAAPGTNPIASMLPVFDTLGQRPRMAPRAAPPAPAKPQARAAEPPAAPEAPPVTKPAPLPHELQPAVVLPLARSPIRPDAPRVTPTVTPRHQGIGRLLRTASARGASSLYLMADARPSMRIDDEMIVLESEPPLSTPEVESLVLELAPSGSREALAGGGTAEWVCELPDVGRVRCLSFRDQRGPGAVFRLIPTRLVSADQLGLSRDIQALCGERDGLIIVAGPRLSGKSTLVSAFVDLINRNRSDYVITLESEIKFVHENRKAMVSQREVRGDVEDMATHVRTALRENPDVIVIDDLRNAEVVALALEAADSGHLVIGSVTAHTTMTAIGRFIDSAPTDRQTHVALALSETLRGAIAQVLLRKTGGGRVAARELLLNTPSVSALLAEGKVGQLPLAIDSGRKYGMVPMNDALAAFVQSGAVDAREAYRKAYDRVAFLEQLKRDGVDTSFVERLA
jgi:twitching motility protein PilT